MAVGHTNKFGAAFEKRLSDVTPTEFDVLDGVSAGTAAASKAVVLDSNKAVDEVNTAKLSIGTSGSETEVTATGAELNELDGIVASFDFAASAGAANVCEVAITLKDAAGSTITDSRPFLVWLSDDSGGTGLTATSASGTVQAKSASGTDFAALTAKKALIVQPLATGVYTLEITDTSKTAFYVCASTMDGRATSVSTQLATGDYGSA